MPIECGGEAGADARFEDIATLLAAMTGEQPAALLSRSRRTSPQSTRPFVPTMLRQSPAGSLPLRAEVETSHGVNAGELLQRLAGEKVQQGCKQKGPRYVSIRRSTQAAGFSAIS